MGVSGPEAAHKLRASRSAHLLTTDSAKPSGSPGAGGRALRGRPRPVTRLQHPKTLHSTGARAALSVTGSEEHNVGIFLEAPILLWERRAFLQPQSSENGIHTTTDRTAAAAAAPAITEARRR